MKKFFIIFLLIGLIFSVSFLSVSADAEEGEASGEEQLNENIDELLDTLDTEELEAYLNQFAGEFLDGSTLKERLKEMITGDYAQNYDGLFSFFLSLFFDSAKGFVSAFALICAVCIFDGIVNAVKGNFISDSVGDIIHYVCFAAILVLLLSCLIPTIRRTEETVNSLKTQMEIIFPILVTLMAAGGGTVSAAVYQPAVAFLSEGITEIISNVVFPLAILIIALSIVGNISGKINLNGFSGLFSGINKWLIGISFTLYSVFLTVQGITSASYDGLSLRAAKYAIGNGVPMIGGFLSSGMDLVLAGSVLIKNSLGGVAVLLIVFTIAEPLVLLISFSLLLKLVAAICTPIADARISGFLTALSGNIGYFIAGLLAVAFMYFITLLLLICSSGVIF